MRVLLSLIHLLLELLGLLVVGEGEASQASFQFEGVEEDAVLVVGKALEYLLIPDHAAVCGRQIHEFDPEGVAYQIVGQDGSTLQTGVGPSLRVGMCNIEPCYSDGMNLVGRLGDYFLDRSSVFSFDQGRHVSSGGVCGSQGLGSGGETMTRSIMNGALSGFGEGEASVR